MEQIKDLLEGLPEVQTLAKERPSPKPKPLPKITPKTNRFLDAALTIELAPDAVERAYMARQLVQCTLPHSNPGNVPLWKRRNGNYTLTLQPGAKDGELLGYPYGTIPRLLLFWIVTEAVKTNKRKLELGNSLAQFMRQLGLDPSRGGKRSDATRLKNQMERLLRAHISFDVKKERPGQYGESWLDMQIGPKGEYWWSLTEPEQGAFWGSWVELGEAFFAAIKEAPIPSDMRALRALKSSAMALDLYVLAIHKAFIANKRTQGQFITWEALQLQLGAEYDKKRLRNFSAKVKPMLRRVSLAFPARLKFELHKEGVTFLPGTQLPVAPRPSLA